METIVIKYVSGFKYKPESECSLYETIRNSVLKGLIFWIPKASPDYDKRIQDVSYWYLEVDMHSKYAQREIGFDNSDVPILHAPTEANYGFWTDSENVFEFNDCEIIDKASFNKLWVALNK